MTELHVGPMRAEDVGHVVRLLHERNGTVEAYVRWKYGATTEAAPRGAVARLGNEVVGCFGLLPRVLRFADGTVCRAGWFADWYVRPRARGLAAGRALLAAVTALAPVVVGHPGPSAAQALCRAAGYRAVPFQRRRRVVLHRGTYERARTRHRPKALAMAAIGLARSAVARAGSMGPGWPTLPAAGFVDHAELLPWTLAQPVAPGVRRRAGTWRDGELSVTYFDTDDGLHPAHWRRVVLACEGPRRTAAAAWRGFFTDAAGAGCLHVDLFTTEPGVDAALRAHGAWRVPDPPVLVHADRGRLDAIRLEGVDRENWSYLAAERAPVREAAPVPSGGVPAGVQVAQ